MVSAWMDGTQIRRTVLADQKVLFEIVYPAYLNHQYTYIESNSEVLDRFRNYFKDIVEDPHEVKIVLDLNQTEAEGNEDTPLDLIAFQNKPEHAYQKDLEREPMLEVLDSVFKFQFVGSQKLKEVPKELQNIEKEEAPDEYAEDA